MFGIDDMMTAAGTIGGAMVTAKGNEKAAKMAIDWERERATNAHQWEVQDLQNAGLNPVLSAGGSGAVTSGVAAPEVPDYGQAVTSALNVATQRLNQVITAKKADVEMDNIKADTGNKKVMAENIAADTILKQRNAGLITNQQAKTIAEEMNLKTQTALNNIEIGLKEKFGAAEKKAAVFRDVGLGVGGGSAAVGALGKFIPGINPIKKIGFLK